MQEYKQKQTEPNRQEGKQIRAKGNNPHNTRAKWTETEPKIATHNRDEVKQSLRVVEPTHHNGLW